MLFTSLIFIFGFLPAVLLVNCLLKAEYRNYFLLAASIFFYAWGEPGFVLVMLASISANYFFGILIGRLKPAQPAAAKAVLILAVVSNLSLFFVFKYLNFAISNIDYFFHDLIPQTNIRLPIGISFFTFQAMSYVIDVYRGYARPQYNLFYLGLYISLFPQLIAGPIVRYNDIEKQILSRTVTFDDFSEGVRRFMIGFNKKILIANSLANVTDWAFSHIGRDDMSFAGAWIGAVCYALQIYFDFGGYSDMAIGLGRMLGFRFRENFIYPYSKPSVRGFWTENHISLSTWFRDYVYYPLGGSKGSTFMTIRNMFIVWAITGIWHGASWIFLLWGLMHFSLIVIEKYGRFPERFRTFAGRGLWRVFSLVMLVVLNGVLFRNPGYRKTLLYLKSLFGINRLPLMTVKTVYYLHEYGVIMVFAVLYAFALFRTVGSRINESENRAVINVFGVSSVVVYTALFLVSVSYLIMGSYNPFIYFNF